VLSPDNRSRTITSVPLLFWASAQSTEAGSAASATMTAARPLPIPAERLRFGCRLLTRPIRKRSFSRDPFHAGSSQFRALQSMTQHLSFREHSGARARISRPRPPARRSFGLFVLCASPTGPGIALPEPGLEPSIRRLPKNTPSGRCLRSDTVPRKMFDRTEGGDVARFAEHLVDFACVKLLGIDHLSGVLLDNN
jgi:hypothetical protein